MRILGVVYVPRIFLSAEFASPEFAFLSSQLASHLLFHSTLHSSGPLFEKVSIYSTPPSINIQYDMASENRKDDETEIEHVSGAPAPQFDPSQEKVNVQRGDDALKFTVETGSISWTPKEESRVLRKIDMRLMPLVSPW
jgi:hypothetical protein